ncbi:MAG: hypothetical protein ACLVML_05575 [Candidatus Gastranaerophilaceae bacterium]|nr:hypothetical protein [Christensenellales bacterium]
MKKNVFSPIKTNAMIAFVFDSGKISSSFYGDAVFESIIKGKEIVANSKKIVFSVGDIFDKSIYDDITPYIVRDELCTIPREQEKYEGILYAVLMEDIDEAIALNIDLRLKNEFKPYIGMTSIDIESSDARKQFWKNLIRRFSIELNTITCFGSKEEGYFAYSETSEKNGFHVNYDGFLSESNQDGNLFSTRQSSFIQSIEQLEFVDGKSDMDRGILEMNFALVQEVNIAGVQIWKAIEDIERPYITKTGNGYSATEYIFTSMYQAAQGIERLLKIIIELILYRKDDSNNQNVRELLLGHNHPAMFKYISENEKILLNKNCNRLINILSKFYSNARYHRFSYNESNTLELEFIREFGHGMKDDDFDEQLKNAYGKALGQTAQALYKQIESLSDTLNIYVYELSAETVARLCLKDYYGDNLYNTLKQIKQSKKELIWYLMKKGNNLPVTKLGDDIAPLPFEECDIADYVYSLVTTSESCLLLHDFVSFSYDELVGENKSQWKERVDAIDVLVGNPKLFFDDEDLND